MRKRASSVIAKVLLSFVVLLSLSEYPETVWSAQINPENIVLTWAGDTKTTQAVTWQTTDSTIDKLQYREAGVRRDFAVHVRTIPAEQAGMLVKAGKIIYSAEMKDLKPGTRYFYRIGNGKDWSEIYAFQTAGEAVKNFKFLVFGDSQSSLYNTWHNTIRQAFKLHADAAFFTNVGDLVNVGNDEQEWQEWFSAVSGIAETLPAMPLTGNHEMYTPQWKVNARPVLFTAQFQLPRNGPEGLKEQVYSFDYGNTHFVMLDSQEREEGEFVPAMLAKQQVWLEKDLAQTDKLWKVIFIHRPPYHTQAAKPNENIRQAFVPIWDKYNVDVVFSGHEHVYARTYPLYNGEVTDRGTVYITTGRSGDKLYENGAAGAWDEVFYNPTDQPNYLSVEVQGDIMVVKAWKQNGEPIDSWRKEKSATRRDSYFLIQKTISK
ncbi:purple acid phosphatase family protein [Sporomusa aerivorans]|uniref:purple acid phosphatase family protein n=1 Tax=Sporomusa aerivorans TaxID=204936 RepID=UPI00352A44A5